MRTDIDGSDDDQALDVEVQGRLTRLSSGTQWLVGRHQDADVVVSDPTVSRTHAVISRSGRGWRVADAASANGLWCAGRRVSEVGVVDDTVTVLLGGWPDGVQLRLSPPTVDLPADSRQAGSGAAVGGAPKRRHPLRSGRITIGRARDNDIVLSDLLVSRHHAELVVLPDSVEIVDLGSANGTFLAGRRVSRRHVADREVVAVGPYLLQRDGASLVEWADEGDVRFGADGVTVSVDAGQRLVDDVGFTLAPRTLMAVVGPSGAGKSTLLGALTGLRPATAGSVTYAGLDLYRHYDQLRHRIGFVPQDDILHTALTVREALTYGAELRFPSDTTPAERAGRVVEVAAELSLTERLDTRISRLSGGERKRASTALELLPRPSLLFLDEPTSGLDTDLDREVMHRLRALADGGRTVVVVTHNLEHLQVCDLVMVLARGGHLAYLGPPDGAFAYFGAPTWADVFAQLKARDGAAWAASFRSWPIRAPSAEPLSSAPGAPTRAGRRPAAPDGRSPARTASGQFGTLVRRQVKVTSADRTLGAILVALPVVLALIARVVPAENGLARLPENTDARQLLLVLVVGASLMGSAAAVRELVKERAIYRRERAIGLSVWVYLASKVVVLGGLTLAQGVVLTLLALAGRPGAQSAVLLGSPLVEMALTVAAVAAVSALIGLLISALVRDENQAMPLLVLLSMAQLVLCGALVPVVGRVVLEQLSWLLPARWGFSATAATVGLLDMGAPADPPDQTWRHDVTTWLTDLSALAAIAVVAVLLTHRLLLRLDPRRGPSR